MTHFVEKKLSDSQGGYNIHCGSLI